MSSLHQLHVGSLADVVIDKGKLGSKKSLNCNLASRRRAGCPAGAGLRGSQGKSGAASDRIRCEPEAESWNDCCCLRGWI